MSAADDDSRSDDERNRFRRAAAWLGSTKYQVASVRSHTLTNMTPNEQDALSAALDICRENDGAATADAIAARLGLSRDRGARELLPLVVQYFDDHLPGDDGIVVVRKSDA